MLKTPNFLLVIAIGDYEKPMLFKHLPNVKIDSDRLITVLENRYDFQHVRAPMYNEEATRRNIINTLDDLVHSTKLRGANLIIYFAGHGEMHAKTRDGYWVPYDALKAISDYVPTSTIVDLLRGIDAQHILIISDACFSGAFLNNLRASGEETYDKMAALKSRCILTSGGEEFVEDGKPLQGSPFSLSLCDFLERNEEQRFSFLDLSASVIRRMQSSSNQLPVSAHISGTGHEHGGQMVFTLRTITNQEPTSWLMSQQQEESELEFIFEDDYKTMRGNGQYVIHTDEIDKSELKPTYTNCYVQIGVVNKGRYVARRCKADLLKIERKIGPGYTTVIEQPLNLSWSYQDAIPADIRGGGKQFLSLTSIEPNDLHLWPQTSTRPYRYKKLLNKPGTYRFSILVSGENCLPIQAYVYLDIKISKKANGQKKMYLKSAWLE